MTESPDPEQKRWGNIPLDSALPDWLQNLPEGSRSYAALARWDRPVGIWLLLLPCWMGLAQMRIPNGFQWMDLLWIILFAIGAVARVSRNVYFTGSVGFGARRGTVGGQAGVAVKW